MFPHAIEAFSSLLTLVGFITLCIIFINNVTHKAFCNQFAFA